MSTEPWDVEPEPAVPQARWSDCFETAIRYFHENVDSEIQYGPDSPTTAREYYHERGWSDETIRTHLLGWAPGATENGLITHLRAKGFNDEEILSTGLVTKDLRPLWNGRYVFPYLDADGKPVYAISRALGSGADDGHPEDFMSGKYAKLAHSKDYVNASEPIFGLENIRDGQPIIVTEGIADAISVQQEGYPCLSPVTTRFTQDKLDSLLAVLSEREIPRVYIIQDAEFPSSEYSEQTGQLTLQQVGPGLEGALATASFLTENGIDARVNTPPQPSVRKQDLNDYLREDWGSMSALLASAKPPSQHPAYEPPAEETATRNSPTETPNENGKQSLLSELDFTDVSNLPVGYRGKNPLGHTGASENYFTITENNGKVLAHDHKRGVSYTAYAYLLCDAGERSVNNPEGRPSDREIFVAWKHGKKIGVLPDDDPIPHRGIVHVAVSHDLCKQDEIQGDWKIPPHAYSNALEVVRDEYGLDPSREWKGGDTELDELDYSPPASTGYKRETTPEISLDDARKRCKSTIDRAVRESRFSLIDALPAQGKSRGVVELAAETETPLIVLAPRRDLLETEYKEWCEEFGLTSYSLPAFQRHCECGNGNHGEEWERRVNKLYSAGLTGREIHELAERKFGRPLPCQDRGPCPYLRMWDFDSEDYDVLLGHYTHAYRSDLLKGRLVAIDESPHQSFLHSFTRTRVASAVTHYLQEHEGLPFENYTDLTENRSDPYRREDALAWFREENEDVLRDGYSVVADSNENAHAYAPLMTYALLVGDDLGNGWEHATLPGVRLAARNRDPQTRNGKEGSELSILVPPSFEDAEAVIGLDGTPLVPRWGQCLGTSVDHYQVLNERERAGYLRSGLGYTLYKMYDSSNPYSSGYHVKPGDDQLYLEQIGAWERRLPDLITSRKALMQYKDADMGSLYGKAGYYGNLKGTNSFKHSRVGAVIGSPHYGDNYLELWGALAGERVERTGSGMTLDYGEYGNQILQTMREGEVLQALMRFGRDGEGATIYIMTAALPEWVRSQVLVGDGKLVQWSDGMKQVLAAIGDRGQFRTADLLVSDGESRVLCVEDPDPLSERQVNRNLTALYEYGFLDREKEGTGWLWKKSGADRVTGDMQVVRTRTDSE